MTPDVVKELQRENDDSEFHKALLDHAKNLIRLSRSTMSRKYRDWDMQNQVYKGERVADKEDLEQNIKGKPVKMVVPNTFAQVQTFCSFLFLQYTQNDTFFQLLPNGSDNFSTKWRDSEKMLERDLRYNQWNQLLFQLLLDVGRFGPGIQMCEWTRKVARFDMPQEPTMASYQGVQTTVRPGHRMQEFVKYEGNLIRSVSPYRFFPDTRFPLVDFQKGEFCGSEEEYSKATLRDLEAAGEVAGIEWVKPLPRNMDSVRGGQTRTTMDLTTTQRGVFLTGPTKSEGTVLVTKLQVWIVPSKFKFGPNDERLGPEEYPVLYHLWYANDNRVIRVEPCGWWHNEFGYTVSQFTPDMHQTLSFGLADLIYRLQDVITWLINARVTDVRRNIRGRYIVDPATIDTKSLDGDGDIYLRKGANAALSEKALRQVDVRDVTSSHFSDADTLSSIIQVVTGINQNALGQYAPGRRSAREAAQVQTGASGRMKMHGSLIFESGPGRLGRLMMSNQRQMLELKSFAKCIGKQESNIQNRYLSWKGTPEDIITADDYFFFDDSLDSQRSYQSQRLQELLMAIMGNPDSAKQLDLDPRALLEEVQWLNGDGDVNRFSLSQRVAAGVVPPLPPTSAEIAASQPPPPPPPPPEPIPYKDAPPDIRRQIEARDGFVPSKEKEEVVSDRQKVPPKPTPTS